MKLSNYQPLEGPDAYIDVEANNSLASFTETKLEQLYGKSVVIDKKITYIEKMFSKQNNIKFLRKQNNSSIKSMMDKALAKEVINK